MILQPSINLLLPLLLMAIPFIKAESLNHIINELNKRLLITTNILYCNQTNKLEKFENKYLRHMPLINLMIFTSTESFNISQLEYNLGADNKLFLILCDEPPYDFFRVLDLHFQHAEFVLVLDTPLDLESDTKWFDFVRHQWQQGYVQFLFYTSHDEKLYHKIIFPELVIEEVSIETYASFRGAFRNLHGYPIRVAAYNNVPRCMLYTDRWGKKVISGFYMKFLRAFIHSRNGSFVPVLTPSDSPGNCTLNLRNETVDVCSDALAANPAAFSLTHGFRIASANVLVTHAKPLHSYRYLTAPFQLSVWLCLASYVVLVVSFLSFIHWFKCSKWDFSKHLLEVFSSLLFSGFFLKEIRGRERYILFGVLFIAGFVYSTMYLGLLKSMLISEVFERQIDSFESLVDSNITLMVDAYDKTLFAKYNMPEILLTIMEEVNSETLLRHRNRFDQDYAYILFSDRMALYDYAQQFLKHPKLLRIPIDFSFLYTGIPMRKRWFLKAHLGRAWYWAFESGLTRKLALDADFEAVRVGYLNFLVTEHQEAQPLDVDYFVMPAIALGVGYLLALISFVIEMTAWRMSGFLGCKMKMEKSAGCPDSADVIDNEIEEDKWKHFFNFAWQLGYVKFIVYSLHSRIAYDKLFFPTLRIRETSIKDYANFRDFRNVEGFKVRVAAYNSIPRSFIYQDARGKTIYAGNNTVDLCADALVRTPNVFTISKEVRLSFANVIVPSAKPLSSFRYLSGPFKLQVWGLLLMYVILITGFLSLIHWIKSERWGFTHTLLEVFSSILNLGFHLKAIHGKERSILFGILFLSGFVFSTIYLGFLKSMLISEVFEKQIETFEELHEQNIPLLIDHYDRTLFLKLYFPEPLWAVVQSVSSETLTNRRNSFDTDYAYVMFPDRIDMFHYVQQYMRHPKFRRIKIDFCFLFAGFPMSRKWFLKHDLSRAWLHGFESGLLNKMVEDAYRETVLHGYLNSQKCTMKKPPATANRMKIFCGHPLERLMALSLDAIWPCLWVSQTLKIRSEEGRLTKPSVAQPRNETLSN
ncbi:uncharacterized protein LOC108093602 [Drosophila ficusphila]|uniref:uncharacterized protein LOC108093602 n=1 Tax=Drosophila ficusphila TaxID=30025 RepID=UPI0007E83602|nr:uncharacterized protein LOC108093602 [Drosophila ficusphila]